MRKIALFDIDNTIYDGFSIIGLTEYQVKKGLVSHEAQKKLELIHKAYKKGKLDYETATTQVLHVWTENLQGQRLEDLVKNAKEFFEKNRKNFFPYSFPVIAKLLGNYDVYFVTGEPQFVGLAVQKIFRATGFLSSIVEIKDGILTGKVEKELTKSKNKNLEVRRLMDRYSKDKSIALGDSEGDIGMLEEVEIVVCVNPKEDFAKYARSRNWAILRDEEIEEFLKNLKVLE